MATYYLVHCNPIAVIPVRLDPIDVQFTYEFPSCEQGGQIDVLADELPAPIVLPLGSSGSIGLPGLTSLRLHYKKAEGGPDHIEVECTAI
jgi:hypothetical protein